MRQMLFQNRRRNHSRCGKQSIAVIKSCIINRLSHLSFLAILRRVFPFQRGLFLGESFQPMVHTLSQTRVGEGTDTTRSASASRDGFYSSRGSAVLCGAVLYRTWRNNNKRNDAADRYNDFHNRYPPFLLVFRYTKNPFCCH